MFEMLKELYLKDREMQKAETLFFIEHGFTEKWLPGEQQQSDNGLKRYSTATRWEQYQSGKITRKKAVEHASKRATKAHDTKTEKGLAKLERVAAAPDLSFVALNVEYKRSAVWGYNPTATSTTNTVTTYGHASGCGYDKESAAIASAFNANDSILKVLYTLKENALKEGKTDESRTTYTGRDNRGIIGYGAGYSVLPYFEGGVGAECFWSILKKAGFIVKSNYGKHENNYTIYPAA